MTRERSPDPSAAALRQARQRLGVEPLALLFDRLRGPIGTVSTLGVFWRGLRLVAWDGTCLEVADSPANVARFRRHASRTTRPAGCPQVRLTALVECGTRAVIDAVFGPQQYTEPAQACALLPSLRAGMLLLADRGIHSGVEPRRQRRGRRSYGLLAGGEAATARRERQEPSRLPHAVVGRGRDDRALLTQEEVPVFRRAECGEVIVEHRDELGRNGHTPNILDRPVLQSEVIVGLPRVGPLLADRRTSPVEQRRPPALFLENKQTDRAETGFNADAPARSALALPTPGSPAVPGTPG